MTAAAHCGPRMAVATSRLRIAVVIPTFGREQALVDTVRMVLAQDPPADEVLIIDQTPQHEPTTAAFLAYEDCIGAIRWIRQSPPNLPAARNRGLRETSCDIVLFLDDDVILEPGLIGHHASNHEHSDVEAVTGRLIGRTPPRGRRNPAPHLEFRHFDFDSPSRKESVAAFCGGNHSIRRSTALALGGYDENYIGWAFREETDLALRLHRERKRIVYDPRAALLHLAAPSGGCRISGFQKLLCEWKVSFPAHYFAWKHLFPTRCFWVEEADNLRRAVLCRKNACAPWRLPVAFAAFVWSFFHSCWRWQRCR